MSEKYVIFNIIFHGDCTKNSKEKKNKSCHNPHQQWCMITSQYILAIFAQNEYICYFLFASVINKELTKWGLLLKSRVCS